MHSLQLVSNNQQNEIHPAKQKLITQARLAAMEELLNGGLLEQCVTKISASLENIFQANLCQVVLRTHSAPYFKPIGATSGQYLNFIAQAIEHYYPQNHIDEDGQTLKKSELIAMSLTDTKAWSPMLESAKEHDLHSAWTFPIVTTTGLVIGLISIFSNTAKMPTNESLAILQQSTQTLAALISQAKSKALELRKYVNLHEQLDARQHVLNEANELIKKVLAQRTEAQNQIIELENMAALGTMMSSLTHEMNTPIGVAITASSFMHDLQRKALNKLHHDQLKKSELVDVFNETCEASLIIERNLSRADELIKTFKQLSIDQHSQDLRSFNVCDYVFEVLLSLKPRLKSTRHKFCVDIPSELTISSNAGAISQLLINLIMNSSQHAFKANENGRISIRAKKLTSETGSPQLQLDYLDNGIGMTEHTIENIYKPFFTLARETGGSGLGMHICNNIVMKVLRGHIDCESEIGRGVHFTITFPI